jgi:hypothetical protein
MGDHTTETSQKLEKRCNESYARDLLRWSYLNLDDDSIPWMVNHIDCFVSQSRSNESVEILTIRPLSVNGHDEIFWDKVGQAIGSLQALEALHISGHYYHDVGDSDEDDDEVVPIPDWEIIARILKYVRQNVTVKIDDARVRSIEEVQPFVRAICGHPTITSFQDSGMFPYESLGTLLSTLTTLPALESVMSGAPELS